MTCEEMIDVDAVKERFMGNYGLFSMYLYQFAQGELLHNLEQALKEENREKAFDIAHDMKGVILNLSLTSLENQIAYLVEVLRNGKFPEQELLETFQTAYVQTAERIEQMKQEGTVLF